MSCLQLQAHGPEFAHAECYGGVVSIKDAKLQCLLYHTATIQLPITLPAKFMRFELHTVAKVEVIGGQVGDQLVQSVRHSHRL